MIYKKVREPPLPPIQAIQCVTEASVKRQRWPKEGKDHIAVEGGHELQQGAQVEFQGQQAHITRAAAGAIHISHRLALRTDDMKITQTVCTAQPVEMHKLLKEAWAKLFNREPVEVTDQQWLPALQKIQELEEQQPFEMTEILPSDLQKRCQPQRKPVREVQRASQQKTFPKCRVTCGPLLQPSLTLSSMERSGPVHG